MCKEKVCLRINVLQFCYLKLKHVTVYGIIYSVMVSIFLLFDLQCSLKKHRSASFTFVQEDFDFLNYIGWEENNTVTGQPFETPRATKICSS